MSDLSATPQPSTEAAPAAEETRTLWMSLRKRAARIADWFAIQPVAVKAFVVAALMLIPLTAAYSVAVMQKQAEIAEQVKIMGAEGTADASTAINPKLPIVFGLMAV